MQERHHSSLCIYLCPGLVGSVLDFTAWNVCCLELTSWSHGLASKSQSECALSQWGTFSVIFPKRIEVSRCGDSCAREYKQECVDMTPILFLFLFAWSFIYVPSYLNPIWAIDYAHHPGTCVLCRQEMCPSSGKAVVTAFWCPPLLIFWAL